MIRLVEKDFISKPYLSGAELGLRGIPSKASRVYPPPFNAKYGSGFPPKVFSEQPSCFIPAIALISASNFVGSINGEATFESVRT